jgi:hypothetical protein
MMTNDKLNYIGNLDSAWLGHIQFAVWLTNYLNPAVTVDLGVDHGVSTFSLAVENPGTVYGIDLFQGDFHTGLRNTQDSVENSIKHLDLQNVVIIKGDFNEIAKIWDKEIDILHIDGLHAYEAVKNDFETWSKFLKEDGVIIMHDTYIDIEGFGVKQFFKEITLPKLNFMHSAGLGIVSKNLDLINSIKTNFPEVQSF